MIWTLFDYGVGNLHSLRKALEAAGAATAVTSNPDDLADADVVVLPGVGAFGHVMESLRPARAALRQRHADGRPIFGVCIGQQVLYEGSDETPGVPGLGILSGTVKRLPPDAGVVPEMGWNTIATNDPVLADADGAHVYYVHSYAAPVTDDAVATTEYGMTFAAAVRNGSTFAVQFHPEKSSKVGQRILRNLVAEVQA